MGWAPQRACQHEFVFLQIIPVSKATLALFLFIIDVYPPECYLAAGSIKNILTYLIAYMNDVQWLQEAGRGNCRKEPLSEDSNCDI